MLKRNHFEFNKLLITLDYFKQIFFLKKFLKSFTKVDQLFLKIQFGPKIPEQLIDLWEFHTSVPSQHPLSAHQISWQSF
tara:strand:+ start:8813 stop:9049 length:237 start_codon:yes stop_codon:yes gene_type:complete